MLDDFFDWVYEAVVLPSPRQLLRRTQRSIERQSERLERRTAELGNAEGEMISRMKAHAKVGNTHMLKALASRVMRARHNAVGLERQKVQLAALSSKVDALEHAVDLRSAVGDVSSALASISSNLNSNNVGMALRSYEESNIRLDEFNEAMSSLQGDEDTLEFELEEESDFARAGDNPGAGASSLVQQILDEVDLESNSSLATTTTPASRQGTSNIPNSLAAERVGG
jgi:phage shock protein A